jgi:hypothetical protein
MWFEASDDFDEVLQMRCPGHVQVNTETTRLLSVAALQTGRFASRREAWEWVESVELVEVEEDGLVFTDTRPIDTQE